MTDKTPGTPRQAFGEPGRYDGRRRRRQYGSFRCMLVEFGKNTRLDLADLRTVFLNEVGFGHGFLDARSPRNPAHNVITRATKSVTFKDRAIFSQAIGQPFKNIL